MELLQRIIILAERGSKVGQTILIPPRSLSDRQLEIAAALLWLHDMELPYPVAPPQFIDEMRNRHSKATRCLAPAFDGALFSQRAIILRARLALKLTKHGPSARPPACPQRPRNIPDWQD